MSEPRNPLDGVDSYTVSFLLAAFKDTLDAQITEMGIDMGPIEGSPVGNGRVVLNDTLNVRMSRFVGKRLEYDYSWIGPTTSTTMTTGKFTLHSVSGMDFIEFLRNKVVRPLGTSIENLSFAMRIVWRTADENEPFIISERIIFGISDIDHVFSRGVHKYTITFTTQYNTRAHITSLSRVYSMNITHKDGNLHEELPTAEPSGGGIVPRGEEDSSKLDLRTTRIDKSKPMRTLEDAFESFEVDLNESTKIHKNQLQVWQRVIRDDFVDKLETPSQQQKEIKVVFRVHLDPKYKDYELDNRNLPFEQPEQRQNIVGIRSIPTKSGEKIPSVIDRIMRMAKKAGEDAGNGYTYKICPVLTRVRDTYFYDIVIKQYQIPVNYSSDEGINTGPGEGGLKPLTFFFKPESNTDIRILTGGIGRTDSVDVVEDVLDEELGRVSYGGDREPITGEREREVDFFKTGYSGFRAKISNSKTLSVEYPRELANSLKKNYFMQTTQQSGFTIDIHGNPYLLNDIIRNPIEVFNQQHTTAKYYRFPEVLPMYAKVIVSFETDFEEIPPGAEGGPPQPTFYHKSWMHIKAIHTVIDGSSFHQTLTICRSDLLV